MANTQKNASTNSGGNKAGFVVNYAPAITQFSSALQKFPLKKILYRNMFRGKGLEFDSYRDFTPEDDASLIDWMATLRAQKPTARKYVEERDLDIYFVVDVSNSMLFGSNDKLKSEYAAEMILALAHLVIASGDRVGLFMIGEGITLRIRPGTGKKHFFSILQALSNPKNYGGDLLAEEGLDEIRGLIKNKYSVFIFVSDFIRLHKTFEEHLKYLSLRYETISIMVRDPFDDELPDTNFQFSIKDPYSNRQTILDPTIAKDQYKRIVEERKERVKKMFVRLGVDLIEVKTNQDFSIPLSSFLRSRSKGERL